MKPVERMIVGSLCAYLVVASACLSSALADAPPPSSSVGPRVFLLDAGQLQANKQRLKDGDKTLVDALARLEADAQATLSVGPFTVTDKEFTPPSGDKHDYMSQAPYF